MTRRGRKTTAGRIVEVEAYVGPDDPAAHGFRNRITQRNRNLFGPPGRSYVFLSYGLHWCFNAVTEKDGYPAAVLIRALEPLEGLELMSERRQQDDPRLLCAGPGRLSQALGITGREDGKALDGGRLGIVARSGTVPQITAGPRIGITRARSWPLRFCESDSVWLSRPAG